MGIWTFRSTEHTFEVEEQGGKKVSARFYGDWSQLDLLETGMIVITQPEKQSFLPPGSWSKLTTTRLTGEG